MNIYSMSSGDNDPSNDYVRMHVAMDAGTSSNIRIYNSGISGVIQYSSTSDYAWKVERVKYISEETVELSASENQKIGYPSGFAWIPGDSVCSLSNSEEVETGKLDSLTEKSELSNNEYLKSGSLVLQTYLAPRPFNISTCSCFLTILTKGTPSSAQILTSICPKLEAAAV